MRALVVAAAILLALSAACTPGDARPKKGVAGGGTPPPSTVKPGPDGLVPAGLPRTAAFSAERAWKQLEAQVAFGPRAHGTPGHERLRAHLAEHMRACGAEVRVHEFSHRGAEDAAPRPFYNVIGRFNPAAAKWVLVGTHYDTRLWADEDPDPTVRTRPIPGANDGGSGTAVMLEIATVLRDMPPDHGVALVFFDGEDYGRERRFFDYFLGSTALARDWEKVFGASRPECAIVLDMVADADLEFRRESKSQQASPWVNDLLWATGRELRIPAFGSDAVQPIYDDQDALLGIGIPAALIIDYAFPWWHTMGDTLDKCAPASLAATGRAVLATVVDRLPQPPPTPGASEASGGSGPAKTPAAGPGRSDALTP